MNEKFMDDADPEFITICAGLGCRMALRREEIAAEVTGMFVDYFERIPNGEIRMCYCSECWTNLKETLGADISEAIARRRCIENFDKEDRGEFYKAE